MTLNEIRSLFLKFFSDNGHQVLNSSSLIPYNDPSLMFTNSGMVQFKNIFLGNEQPKYTRVTTSQKCVRAGGKHNDLENVGYTARHHTFFEMLGNFSFGDYFKAEAIELAWTFLTDVLKINKDKLYVTVYHTDDYAFSTWKKVAGFNDDKIIRIDTNDNFWSMGNTGPCGPCSEIFYDHGEQYEGGLPGSGVEGDRYVEIWNLVFMQNEQFEDGSIKSLPKPSIDTGMGLERIAAVMQGVNDNFSIDVFKKIITASHELSGDNKNTVAHKVIADHLRAMSFLIADGVLPSNEERGYVLRRIMRRAMRYVQNIGYKKPFLHQLVSTLVSVMGDAYPELLKSQSIIKSVILNEEVRFGATLERGLKILQDEIPSIQNNKLSGSVAFKLYDTYGFPIDLTRDILRSQDIAVDEDGFTEEMTAQKTRARKAWVGSGEKSQDKIFFEISEKYGSTEFFGYVCESIAVKVLAIIIDGQFVDKINPGDNGIIITNQTPFYGESGGQIGDSGVFKKDSDVCIVTNTVIYPSRVFGHHVQCLSEVSVGDELNAIIDKERRDKIRCNHSATHLLHKALQIQLGEHVVQKGSLVSDQKLRFDFSYEKSLSPMEILSIEAAVNKMIRDNKPVTSKITTYDDAVEGGAMALFGEKYGEEVRVISMCDSIELCGGTHVSSTGDISIFKIISESAISSGIRRIEALTSSTAIDYYNSKCDIVNKISSVMKCSEDQIIHKITSTLDDKKLLTKQLNDLLISKLSKEFETAEMTLKSGIKIKVAMQEKNDVDISTVRSVVMGCKISDSLIIFASKCGMTQSIVVSAPKGFVVDAKHIGNAICEKFDGKGGGSPEMFQIGGISVKHSLNDIIREL
jgi:alanyl-tRNA synthetase